MAWLRADDQFHDYLKVLARLGRGEGIAATVLWSLAPGSAERRAGPPRADSAGRIPAGTA